MKYYGCHPEELKGKQSLYIVEMIVAHELMNEVKT